MIHEEHLEAAVNTLNAHVAATNSVAASFGAAEALPMMRQCAEVAGISYEALIEFGNHVLTEAAAADRADAREYAEGCLQGILYGALAAREAEDD